MINNDNLKSANILIIDDQYINIEVLEGFFEIQGYHNVKSIDDPRVFQTVFEKFCPDIILLDLTMPYFSGYDIINEIKKTNTNNIFLPVLVLTADVSSESKKKALAAGATDFLTKPYDLIEVGLRVNNLLFTRFLHKNLNNDYSKLEQKLNECKTQPKILNTNITNKTNICELIVDNLHDTTILVEKCENKCKIVFFNKAASQQFSSLKTDEYIYECLPPHTSGLISQNALQCIEQNKYITLKNNNYLHKYVPINNLPTIYKYALITITQIELFAQSI